MTALKQNTIECVGLIPAGGKAERISPLPCSKEIFPFLKDKRVLFGFPDIILQPDDVFVRLMDRMKASNADIVLGLFWLITRKKWIWLILKPMEPSMTFTSNPCIQISNGHGLSLPSEPMQIGQRIPKATEKIPDDSNI